MSAARGSARVLLLACAVLAACLALAALAPAQSPVPGGTVPSTLELSLDDPSSFRRVGRTRDGRNVYVATIRAEVTATDTPTLLSLGFEGTPLRLWRKPLAGAEAKLRLRETASAGHPLRDKTVLVTLTAGGP